MPRFLRNRKNLPFRQKSVAIYPSVATFARSGTTDFDVTFDPPVTGPGANVSVSVLYVTAGVPDLQSTAVPVVNNTAFVTFPGIANADAILAWVSDQDKIVTAGNGIISGTPYLL